MPIVRKCKAVEGIFLAVFSSNSLFFVLLSGELYCSHFKISVDISCVDSRHQEEVEVSFKGK